MGRVEELLNELIERSAVQEIPGMRVATDDDEVRIIREGLVKCVSYFSVDEAGPSRVNQHLSPGHPFAVISAQLEKDQIDLEGPELQSYNDWARASLLKDLHKKFHYGVIPVRGGDWASAGMQDAFFVPYPFMKAIGADPNPDRVAEFQNVMVRLCKKYKQAWVLFGTGEMVGELYPDGEFIQRPEWIRNWDKSILEPYFTQLGPTFEPDEDQKKRDAKTQRRKDMGQLSKVDPHQFGYERPHRCPACGGQLVRGDTAGTARCINHDCAQVFNVADLPESLMTEGFRLESAYVHGNYLARMGWHAIGLRGDRKPEGW